MKKHTSTTVALACVLAMASAPTTLAGSDFNGDGYDDIAVGVPGQSVGGKAEAGEVDIFLSARNGDGVSTNRKVVLRQGIGGCLGRAEEGDRFGSQLASGDFNGDGFDDLVVGTPNETVAGDPNAGVVQAFYGPLNPARDCPEEEAQERWTENDVDYGPSQAGAHFGWALAVGDFDGDQFDDLAIGVPGKTDLHRDYTGFGIDAHIGWVYFSYGSDEGLTTPHDCFDCIFPLWFSSQDYQGYALAAGDFNGDGADDLAVGMPGSEGELHVVYPVLNFWEVVDQDDLAGTTPEPNDRFGAALAAGDFNGDGVDDLIVGVPGEDVRSDGEEIEDAGLIHILPGKEGTGLDPLQAWKVHQSTDGIEQVAEAGDEFGSVLAVADFNHDGHDDLAVGIPKEDRRGVEDAGIVQVIFGGSDGLTTNDTVIHQGVEGIPGSNQAGDSFGAALMTGFFDDDSFADLVVGVPGEDLFADPEVDAGRIVVLYGTWLGPNLNSGQQLDQSAAGLTAEAGEGFGAALLSSRSTEIEDLR